MSIAVQVRWEIHPPLFLHGSFEELLNRMAESLDYSGWAIRFRSFLHAVRQMGTIKNCLFAGSSPRIIKFGDNTVSLTSSYNCLYSENNILFEIDGINYNLSEWQELGYDTLGSFSEDPLNTFDYHLLANSPCLDKGFYLNEIHGVEGAIDLDGNPLPDENPDLGAYEFKP